MTEKRALVFLIITVGVLAFSMWAGGVHAAAGNANTVNPEELGKVKWLRSLDSALQEANKKEKPILLLFQEVPG